MCGASWLRNKGIDKIYKFDPKNPPPRRKQLVYFISADLLTFKHVLDQISGYEALSPAGEGEIRPYNVIVLPTILHTFDELLEAEGLYGVVELYKFNWDFLNLDTGLLSLEIGVRFFREVFIRNDSSLLGAVAHTFRLYNMVLKRPMLTLAYGEHSETILRTVHRIENFRQAPFRDETKDNPDFTAMIVMDRDKDYASCLLTSVVYSALLLELFTYKSGYLTIDLENNKIAMEKLEFLKLNTESGAAKKETSTLRMSETNDAIFKENRYRHFTEVTGLLNSQAKSLGVEGKSFKDMKINEMNEFVTNKLPQVAAQKKELFKHLMTCEAIVQELGGHFVRHQTIEEHLLLNENRKQVLTYVEEQLSTEARKFGTLRLMCLFHVTCGLTPDEATRFITNYCNAFGHQHLTVFSNLSAAKLFPDVSIGGKSNILSNISLPIQKTPFQNDANKLKLFPVEPDKSPQSPAKSAGINMKKDSTCPSYVFNGNYIPVVAQLANILLKSPTFDEMAAKLSHLDVKVAGKFADDSGLLRSLKEVAAGVKKNDLSPPIFPLRPRTLFVFIVGGVTYAEIAACNLVERFTGSKIVLASDAIISGSDLVQAAFSASP